MTNHEVLALPTDRGPDPSLRRRCRQEEIQGTKLPKVNQALQEMFEEGLGIEFGL